MFFGWYGRTARALGTLVGAAFEFQLRRMYRIDDGTIAESERVIVDAAQTLEKDIASDPTRYLVGRGLTLADVTAASLFAPLFAPRGCPWAGIDPPTRVRRLRDELKDTAAGHWVRERYRLDRWPAA